MADTVKVTVMYHELGGTDFARSERRTFSDQSYETADFDRWKAWYEELGFDFENLSTKFDEYHYRRVIGTHRTTGKTIFYYASIT